MSLYDILGVKKTASEGEIKKAYRKKATTHHPDKGGDPEDFKALVVAYNILYDGEKRSRYDNGESAEKITQSQQTEDQEILSTVLSLFIGVVEINDPNEVNIIEQIQMNLQGSLSKIWEATATEMSKIQKFEAALKRLKVKKKENMFAQSAQGHILTIKETIMKLERQKRICEGAFKFLEAYEYEIDARVHEVMVNGFNINFLQPGRNFFDSSSDSKLDDLDDSDETEIEEEFDPLGAPKW